MAATNAGTDETVEPRFLIRGLDSLYVSYYLNTARCGIDWDDLHYRKERVRQSRKDTFSEIELGSERFALKPYGAYPYAFVLVNDDFEVRLTESMQPTCHVRYASKGLWHSGLDALTARVRRWFRSLQLEEKQPEVVSRADWAFDYHLPVIDFDETHFKSRATKDAKWRGEQKAETFQFGTSSIVLRVYDKAKEIEQQSAKAWFHQLWGRADEVWRIEFQVRGDRLKLAGIRTLADLKDLQNDLLRELAENHTSLRVPTNDSNRARWPEHPLWTDLRAQIANMPQSGLVADIDPAKCLEWRIYKTGKSLYGFLKGLGALLHARDQLTDAPTLDHVLRKLPSITRQHHSEAAWREDVERKIKALEYGL